MIIFSPLAEIDIHDKFIPDITTYSMGDKVSGNAMFEVIGKGEDFVRLKIKPLEIEKSKRIKGSL